MNIKQEYLKLSLKGMPITYSEVQWENAPLSSFARFQRFITNITKGNVVFAYNENGEILNRLLTDEIYNATDIRMVDFSAYFRESFDSKESGIPTANVIYIFNIGNEEVRDYTFPDKKLFNIIQTNLQQGGCVILASNVFSPTTFKRNYPTSSTNIVMAQQILKTD